MFFNPFVVGLDTIPAIVYPSEGLERVLPRNEHGNIHQHLLKLYMQNPTRILHPSVGDAEYTINIIWSDENERGDLDIMTDVWMFTKLGVWLTGPLGDVETFRGFNHDVDKGRYCGNSLRVLGGEDDKLFDANYDLGRYIDGPRADLPDRIRLDEDFYIPA